MAVWEKESLMMEGMEQPTLANTDEAVGQVTSRPAPPSPFPLGVPALDPPDVSQSVC
jgi:hypothetical protein